MKGPQNEEAQTVQVDIVGSLMTDTGAIIVRQASFAIAYTKEDEDKVVYNNLPRFVNQPASSYKFNLSDDSEPSTVDLGKIYDPEGDEFTTEILSYASGEYVSLT